MLTTARETFQHYFWTKTADPITTTSTMTSTSTATSKEVAPIITNMSGKGSKTIILDEFYLATYIETAKEIHVYAYTEGKLTYSIPCDHPVKKLYSDSGSRRLYAQFEDNPQVKAWTDYNGNPIELPELWKRIDNLSIGRNFIFHSEPLTGENRPLKVSISDRSSLQLKHTISTEFFKIFDMVENQTRLFVTGIDSNPNNKMIPKNGMLMIYEGLLTNKIVWYKKTYPYDSNTTLNETLNVEQGFVYNSKATPSNINIWDANTYAPVLARKADKDQNQPTLTSLVGYQLAVADSKSIAIYRVDGECQDCDPGFFLDPKELPVSQTDGTKILSQPRILEISKDNPLTALCLFNNDDYLGSNKARYLMVEGYANGLVRIRKLEDLNVMMEFHPPKDMKNVIACETYYTSNRLLVHYGTPSSDGTLALVWDFSQHTPVQAITREALKDRHYDSSQDTVKVFYPNSVVVQSEDQILYYKRIFETKSE